MSEPVVVVPYDTGWSWKFERERVRIVGALGMLTEGGVVENIEHVGSTAVPGMSAKPCIDILVAAWPCPLGDDRIAALEDLGYTYCGENGIPGREYFQKGPHDFHLHVVQGDSSFWTDHLLFRDYLRTNSGAAHRYEETKLFLAGSFEHDRERYLLGKAPLIERLLVEARKWYCEEVGFGPLREVVKELNGVDFPWMVASGWALDLYLERVTRVHHDVDIAVFREDQLELQAFMCERGWTFVTPNEGRLEPWLPGMRLELPRHQVHAHKNGRFIDFLLSERQDSIWRFRREPAIMRASDRLVLCSEDGIAFLAPEVVLLFKSAHFGADGREKDQVDFERVMEAGLEPERRAWLRWALEVHRPRHPWKDQLAY